MADESTFVTVQENAQATHCVQGSRFVSHIHPVVTVADADTTIEKFEAAYSDATHVVPAYRIRGSTDSGYVREWSSDAGEPSGTAGPPALNVLTQRNMVNVVVVIARYYGGTDLGTGGLHRAYSRATTRAIDAATIVPYTPTATIEIRVPYSYSGSIQSILDSNQLDYDATYEETVTYTISLPESAVDSLIDQIQSATHGDATITKQS